MSREIITRRDLPHWYVPGAAYFVTYRLVGTLPASALQQLSDNRKQLLAQKPPPGVSKAEHRKRAHKIWFAEFDNLLDQQTDITWLADAPVAAIVRENLYYHHGSKYHLMAYCVMPNHVHVVFQPILAEDELLPAEDSDHVGERADGVSPLSKIMHSLKSYTAHRANEVLLRQGPFWQRESYDHWIRDEQELERIVLYIQANPAKAGLVQHAQDWYFCSCHDRYLSDGEPTAWLAKGAKQVILS